MLLATTGSNRVYTIGMLEEKLKTLLNGKHGRGFYLAERSTVQQLFQQQRTMKLKNVRSLTTLQKKW